MNEIGKRSNLGWTGRSIEQDLAAVGGIDACEHLDQRGLAGAVLPEKRVHLAAPKIEIDMVQRQGRGEALHEPGHGQNGRARRWRPLSALRDRQRVAIHACLPQD